jgi:hypothetical protein
MRRVLLAYEEEVGLLRHARWYSKSEPFIIFHLAPFAPYRLFY